MIERRGGPRFLLEAIEPVSVGGKVGGQKLDRHVARQSGVARAPDLAHPAGANLSDGGVVREASIGGNVHLWSAATCRSFSTR